MMMMMMMMIIIIYVLRARVVTSVSVLAMSVSPVSDTVLHLVTLNRLSALSCVSMTEPSCEKVFDWDEMM